MKPAKETLIPLGSPPAEHFAHKAIRELGEAAPTDKVMCPECKTPLAECTGSLAAAPTPHSDSLDVEASERMSELAAKAGVDRFQRDGSRLLREIASLESENARMAEVVEAARSILGDWDNMARRIALVDAFAKYDRAASPDANREEK